MIKVLEGGVPPYAPNILFSATHHAGVNFSPPQRPLVPQNFFKKIRKTPCNYS